MRKNEGENFGCLSKKFVSPVIGLGGEKDARVFLFYMKKSSKYWLWGAICIFLINVVFFIFRRHVADAVLLWVVILTPIACLMLYPLTRLLDRDGTSAGEKSA